MINCIFLIDSRSVSPLKERTKRSIVFTHWFTDRKKHSETTVRRINVRSAIHIHRTACKLCIVNRSAIVDCFPWMFCSCAKQYSRFVNRWRNLSNGSLLNKTCNQNAYFSEHSTDPCLSTLSFVEPHRCQSSEEKSPIAIDRDRCRTTFQSDSTFDSILARTSSTLRAIFDDRWTFLSSDNHRSSIGSDTGSSARSKSCHLRPTTSH